MQIKLHFFTFFLHFSALCHTSIQLEPRKTQPITQPIKPRQDQPRTTQDQPNTSQYQPNTSQYQPIRLHQDQTRTKLIVSLGRLANRALLPRCVPRFARSRRAIRCETPCGMPSPVGVPHTHLTMQKTPEMAKKVTKCKKKCEKICTYQKKAVSLH